MTALRMGSGLLITLSMGSAQTIAAATGCAASTEAAVLQALQGDASAAQRDEGFRVRDVIVDPLLHRAFVHVEQCGHPERPLVLLPFTASLSATELTDATQTGTTTQGIARTVLSGSTVAVAMGDAHTQVTVRGRLIHSAAVGSEVDVQLQALQEGIALPGDEAKRVHGRLTAADRVEVQP